MRIFEIIDSLSFFSLKHTCKKKKFKWKFLSDILAWLIARTWLHQVHIKAKLVGEKIWKCYPAVKSRDEWNYIDEAQL